MRKSMSMVMVAFAVLFAPVTAEAKRYNGRIAGGDILISIHCDEDADDFIKRAKQILEETGAQDIACTAEATADFPAKNQPTVR